VARKHKKGGKRGILAKKGQKPPFFDLKRLKLGVKGGEGGEGGVYTKQYIIGRKFSTPPGFTLGG
jgi:hypothetical protein